MNGELRKIKRKYGENMAKLCRRLFPTILENEGVLYNLLISHFEPSRCLYDDLLKDGKFMDFKGYIYKLSGLGDLDTDVDYSKVSKTPQEIFDEIGYNLYECKTLDELNEFQKYYDPDELLCTFKDGQKRLDDAHVFFAVRKDVDSIKRENFTNPKREDSYGVSVLGIQFTKDDFNTVSIKSRYNHTVDNPDSTYSNDLDEIANGLTAAFANTYGFVQKFDDENKNFMISDYKKTKDKFYKRNLDCCNGVNYCFNNIIIDHDEVMKLPPEKYIVMDYFIVDLSTGKVSLYDDMMEDSFVDSMKDVVGVNIEKSNGNRILHFSVKNGGEIKITIDNSNSIIGVVNNEIENVSDDFMIKCENIKSLEMNNVKKVGNNFLYECAALNDLHMDNVEVIEDGYLGHNCHLEKLYFDKLRKVGNDFIFFNNVIKEFYAYKLKENGEKFLESAFFIHSLKRFGVSPENKDPNCYQLNLMMQFLNQGRVREERGGITR